MTAELRNVFERENALFISWGGNIPEANSELNDLQREKINAIFTQNSTAYIGQINFNGKERENLSADNVFTEYRGEKVDNFGAAYVVPAMDNALAEMIIEWNNKKPLRPNLADKIMKRIVKIGGAYLYWS